MRGDPGGRSVRTILFVDDHPIFREGLRRTLESAVANLSVLPVDDASSARRTLQSGRDCDLLLTDYRLPDEDGLSLIHWVRRSFPTIGTGLFCADLSFALIAQARALGVVLCISKARAADDLVSAIQTVFHGGQVFDDIAGQDAPSVISPRRREILVLASKGLPDKTIGDQLGVSENTIRNHWKYIFEQLGVNSRTEAVSKAIRRAMI